MGRSHRPKYEAFLMVIGSSWVGRLSLSNIVNAGKGRPGSNGERSCCRAILENQCIYGYERSQWVLLVLLSRVGQGHVIERVEEEVARSLRPR